MAGITTSVEALEDNKVRLRVEVPEAEFDKAVDAAFRKLAGQVRIDGFRPGKAPRKLLEARLGPDAARDQALRDALPEYYAEAVDSEGLDTIAPPEIDITSGQQSGDIGFDAVVELRPVIQLSGYDALRIELDEAVADDDAIDGQIESLRNRFADLTDSTEPLTDGDFAEVDLKGTIGGEEIAGLSATDYLYEVGSGLLVPELDQELHGTKPGDIVQFDATLPESAREHAGEEVAFRVLVKEAKKKVLPEVTDEWVGEVSEFESVDALRADVAKRIELVAKVRAQMAVRDKVLDAVADLVDADVPATLIDQELSRRMRDMAESLSAQGATIEQYLQATGQDQGVFVAELRNAAERAVRADLALRAVVAQEAIEPSDDEVNAEVERLAERMQEKPADLRKELDRRGVMDALRSDLARSKALQFLVDAAVVVDPNGNPVDLTLPEPGHEDQEEEGQVAPAAQESTLQADTEESE